MRAAVIEELPSTETLASPKTTTEKNSTVEKPSANLAKGGREESKAECADEATERRTHDRQPEGILGLALPVQAVALPCSRDIHGVTGEY